MTKRLHTGGAKGADYEFTINCKHDYMIHSFNGHNLYKVKDNIHRWSDKELRQVWRECYTLAAKNLNRPITKQAYVGKLLCRNCFQILDSDCVYAVVKSVQNIGGATWAIEYAFMNHGWEFPVYIFSQFVGKWLHYRKISIKSYDWKVIDEPPVNFNSITGIGTRDLSDLGKDEIILLMKRWNDE